MFLLDASLPLIDQPAQFAHMLYWNRDGLITKILIRKLTPPPEFWMTLEQTLLLDRSVALWPAEKMGIDVPDDSDEEEAEGGTKEDRILEEDEEISFRKNDVLQSDGASLLVGSIPLQQHVYWPSHHQMTPPNHHLQYLTYFTT